MDSATNCNGSGGKRNIGFNKKQVDKIIRSHKLINKIFLSH